MFCKLKVTDILKSSGWALEKSELPWEQNFIAIGVSPVELLATKFQWSALQINQDSSIYLPDIKLG